MDTTRKRQSEKLLPFWAELIASRNVSINQVAIAIDLTYSSLHNYLTGYRAMPIKVLKALSEYFSIPVSELLDEAGI